MKWPTILVICLGLTAVHGCASDTETAKAYDHDALERMYRADLARANDGAPDAMMRIARYYDNGLSANDRCAGALAALCRVGPVSRWLSGTVVSADRARAYKWYSLAALRSHRNALTAKRSLIPEMSRREIDEGERMVADWLKRRRGSVDQRASQPGS